MIRRTALTVWSADGCMTLWWRSRPVSLSRWRWHGVTWSVSRDDVTAELCRLRDFGRAAVVADELSVVMKSAEMDSWTSDVINVAAVAAAALRLSRVSSVTTSPSRRRNVHRPSRLLVFFDADWHWFFVSRLCNARKRHMMCQQISAVWRMSVSDSWHLHTPCIVLYIAYRLTTFRRSVSLFSAIRAHSIPTQCRCSHYAKKEFKMFSYFDITLVCDRQTDRQRERERQGVTTCCLSKVTLCCSSCASSLYFFTCAQAVIILNAKNIFSD